MTSEDIKHQLIIITLGAKPRYWSGQGLCTNVRLQFVVLAVVALATNEPEQAFKKKNPKKICPSQTCFTPVSQWWHALKVNGGFVL